jgi:hypothetical protein
MLNKRCWFRLAIIPLGPEIVNNVPVEERCPSAAVYGGLGVRLNHLCPSDHMRLEATDTAQVIPQYSHVCATTYKNEPKGHDLGIDIQFCPFSQPFNSFKLNFSFSI